jgi:hypothetical protein
VPLSQEQELIVYLGISFGTSSWVWDR